MLEICPKSQKVAMVDLRRTFRIPHPVLQLFPEPEPSIRILLEHKIKEQRTKKRGGRPGLNTYVLSVGPFQPILWKPLSILRTRAQPQQSPLLTSEAEELLRHVGDHWPLYLFSGSAKDIFRVM